MQLTTIASAVPPTVLTQETSWNRLVDSGALTSLRPGSRALLEKFLLNDNGIRQRHLAVHDMDLLARADPSELNAIFEREVTALGESALQRALHQAHLASTDVDALFVCTCTGYLCPGPSSYIAEAAGMRDNVFLHDLVGQGCGAAIPLLHAASSYLCAHPDHRIACVAVEICSAAFYLDDDAGVLVSLALFGDGASASIWQGTGTESETDAKSTSQWNLSDFQTLHLPQARDTLRFINDRGYLKNQLHRSVPETVGSSVARLYQESGATASHIISHSGGRDVLDAVEAATGKPAPESRAILRDYGNMSSPSVLFALEKHLESSTPRNDLWLVAFGAGFTCHAARLKKVV